MDENVVHCSYEAGILEDPSLPPPDNVWVMTKSPKEAPEVPQEFSIHFDKGIISKVVIGDEVVTDSVASFKRLNRSSHPRNTDSGMTYLTRETKIGYEHGIGRVDIVENRFIGLKSRGCYDTPGLTIARLAHIDLKGLIMDSRVRELRDQFTSLAYAKIPLQRLLLQPRARVENSIVFSQRNVTGEVKLAAYKGNAYVLDRSSNASNLYSEQDASMDYLKGFSPMDTTGFIAIQAIRLKKFGQQKTIDGEPLYKA
ncbi:hypothetical protein ACHAPX_006466 [Trichoderma viride]